MSVRSWGKVFIAMFRTKERVDRFGAWIPAAVLIFVALTFAFGWHS